MIQAEATARYIRTSAQKAGLVLALIRGRAVNHALATLQFTKKTVARDIELVALELLNSAWARSFRTEDYTVLVLYQTSDLDMEETQPVMEGITRSLKCNGTGRQTPASEAEPSVWNFEPDDFDEE